VAGVGTRMIVGSSTTVRDPRAALPGREPPLLLPLLPHRAATTRISTVEKRLLVAAGDRVLNN